MHDRHYTGMGDALPIPYLAIRQFAADSGVPSSEFVTFRTLVRALDDEWLKLVAEKKRKGKQSGSTA